VKIAAGTWLFVFKLLTILSACCSEQALGDTAVSDTVDYTERLVREIYDGQQNKEAGIVMLSTWAPTHPYINGGDRHSIVSEYYVSRIELQPEMRWIC
jgi:hypothetical protein